MHKFSTFLVRSFFMQDKVSAFETIVRIDSYNHYCTQKALSVKIRSLSGLTLAGLVFILFLPAGLNAQIHRIGGGLAFASGTEFNYGETGNPGITIRTWLALDKRSTLSIVPSITAYNRYKLETGYSILTNYMFQGDLDLQYAFFEEGTVRAVAFGGGNFTYLMSYFEPLVITGNETITDQTGYGIGANLGAGLELRMAPKWDFNVSGKYLFSKYEQFIISVQAVYYFHSRRRAFWR